MKRPFRRGRTLLRGLTITMVINHLLNGMILQVPGGTFLGVSVTEFSFSPPNASVAPVRWRRLARQLRRGRRHPFRLSKPGQETLGLEKNPKGVTMSQSVSMIFLLRRNKKPKNGFFHREIDGISCVGSFFWWVILVSLYLGVEAIYQKEQPQVSNC